MNVISIHFIQHLFFMEAFFFALLSGVTSGASSLLCLPHSISSTMLPVLSYWTEVGLSLQGASSRCCSTVHSEGLSHALFGCESLSFLSSSSGAAMETHGFPKFQSLDSTCPYSPPSP